MRADVRAREPSSRRADHALLSDISIRTCASRRLPAFRSTTLSHVALTPPNVYARGCARQRHSRAGAGAHSRPLPRAQGGAAVAYSLLYVRGRQMLWLQVPDEVDVLRTLQQRDLRAQRFARTFRTHKRRDKKREQHRQTG